MPNAVKFSDLVALSKDERRAVLSSLFPFGGLMTDDNCIMHDADRNKLIRTAIKNAETIGLIPAGLRVSVRSPHYGSVKVEVRVTKFLILNPEHVRYGNDNPSHTYYDMPWEARERLTPAGEALMSALKAIASQWRYDRSDAMSDHFDTNYYLDVSFNYELERTQRAWILSFPRSVRIRPKVTVGVQSRAA